MTDKISTTEHRIEELERSLRLAKRVGGLAALGLLFWVSVGATAQQESPVSDVLRTRRLVIEDAAGVQRVLIGDLGERMHGSGSGIAIFDEAGTERFGVSTFPDGRITMGFDAPAGVGHPMRDRLGLGVGADGSAFLMMIDNGTRVPVRIRTEPDANGIGYLEFLDWGEDKQDPKLLGVLRYGLDKAYVAAEEQASADD
jgi:hypothetical protein